MYPTRSSNDCAIFVRDGVTRNVSALAAIAASPGDSAPSVPSRCVLTIALAPPSRLRVSERRTRDPVARSSSQIRSSTSWRYGASIRSARPDPLPDGATATW